MNPTRDDKLIADVWRNHVLITEKQLLDTRNALEDLMRASRAYLSCDTFYYRERLQEAYFAATRFVEAQQ